MPPLSVIPAKAGIQLFPFFVMPVQTGIQYLLIPGSRPPPGRRGGDSSLFISGFRLGPRRNDIFLSSPSCPKVCHAGADRHPYPCPSYRRRPASSIFLSLSCRCRPASIPLSVIPAKAGIQYLLILLVPGLRREDEEVPHYLFLDSRQEHAGMIMRLDKNKRSAV